MDCAAGSYSFLYVSIKYWKKKSWNPQQGQNNCQMQKKTTTLLPLIVTEFIINYAIIIFVFYFFKGTWVKLIVPINICPHILIY